MWKDPIAEEIHTLREQTLARFAGDVHQYDAHILALQAKQALAGSGSAASKPPLPADKSLASLPRKGL